MFRISVVILKTDTKITVHGIGVSSPSNLSGLITGPLWQTDPSFKHTRLTEDRWKEPDMILTVIL